jgi:hypothetical protein
MPQRHDFAAIARALRRGHFYRTATVGTRARLEAEAVETTS